MNIFIVIIIIVIVSVVWVAISTVKDNKANNILVKNLRALGFITSEKLDIINVNIHEKPFHFLIDKVNKNWVLAEYRAPTAKIYNFSDLIDYTVIYRDKGNDIIKGNEHKITASDHMTDNNSSIIEKLRIDSKNCEYLEIRAIYQGKAKIDSACQYFVLFEEQQSFINAQNPDFIIPYTCIINAKDFEKLLYEILRTNHHKD